MAGPVLTDEYLESLIEGQTTVIFTFGNTGTGKTCFLVTFIKYLLETYTVKLNSLYNVDGIEYLEKLIDDLENKILPPSTTGGEISEIDIRFKIEDTELAFTFLDMAGEDLKFVDPAQFDSRLAKNRKKGTLDEKINWYLKHEALNVVLLCFIDYDNPQKQDRLIHKFFNYIQAHFNFEFNRVALIVSKWDKNRKKINLFDFLTKNARQSYLWLDSEVESPNAFPFSIGRINPKDSTKLIKSVNLDYCEDIVDWLYSSSFTIKNDTGRSNKIFSFSNQTWEKVKKTALDVGYWVRRLLEVRF